MDVNKAHELLSAVVDNEADAVEKAAFMNLINQDADLKKAYNDALRIKNLYKSKYKKAEAPEHLKKRIQKLVTVLDDSSNNGSSQFDQESGDKIKTSSPFPIRYVAAAATILIVSMVIVQLLVRATSTNTQPPGMIVENLAAKYFVSAGGALIEPHFKTNSLTEAETYVANNFGMELTIPELNGAEFAGVVMAEFTDHYHAPLLEYIQHDINETVYIFVMNIDEITSENELIRLEDAVKKCVADEDFYVAEIDGHHVVSWMWNDNWYTAISNHNGYDLASRVAPLHYTK